jgi:hypothetical protein
VLKCSLAYNNQRCCVCIDMSYGKEIKSDMIVHVKVRRVQTSRASTVPMCLVLLHNFFVGCICFPTDTKCGKRGSSVAEELSRGKTKPALPMLAITTGVPVMKFFEKVVEEFLVKYLEHNRHIEAVLSGSNVPVRAYHCWASHASTHAISCIKGQLQRCTVSVELCLHCHFYHTLCRVCFAMGLQAASAATACHWITGSVWQHSHM